MVLDIWRQLIVLDASFNCINRGLQEATRLEANPYLEHREIPSTDHRSTALSTKLSQDGKRTSKEVQLRVQVSPDTLEKQDAENHVDEVALQANMVRPHHREYLVQDVANLYVTKSESAALDTQNKMLHSQCEHLTIQDCLRLPAPLDHQMPCFVAIELSNGLEKIKEVPAVLAIELRDQTCVDEDQLRPVSFVIDLSKCSLPLIRIPSVWSQTLEDFLCHVRRFFRPGCAIFLSSEDGYVKFFRLVKADHDITRMQVCVDEVVNENHVEESIKSFVGDILLEYASTILEEILHWDALGELFNQNAAS